jgi:hypothetical protein
MHRQGKGSNVNAEAHTEGVALTNGATVATRGEKGMLHRHLDAPKNEWSVAAVESILERGPDRDVIALLRVVREDPYGLAAEAVLRTIPHMHVYGYPKMFKIAIEGWRSERDKRLGKSS